jgi:hypothetical protein
MRQERCVYAAEFTNLLPAEAGVPSFADVSVGVKIILYG